MKAALYCRVSTEEQGKSGYSLRQQIEALRRYCDAHDLEVVGEFEDRASGASLDRLGLDALRDAVSAGGVDVVLAQDRDRFSREPAHHYVLGEEFLQHGTSLKALNDYGDDSPEGVLTDGILDQLAKFERAKTAERTRRGKVRKAQEGKVVGNGKAPYGFYYADNQYHVDLERMAYVHEIFEHVATGKSLGSTVQHLTEIGAPPPTSSRWHTSTIRKIIRSDTYTGTFYWGKDKTTTTTVSTVEDGKRTYKKKVITEQRPRSEWIAIPVPDSGIPPETVARARENLKGNTKAVSKNDGRTWELSGGVAVCSECGSRMGASSTLNRKRKRYYYYRCSNRGPHDCSNSRNYRAAELETRVKEAILKTFQPETWECFVDDFCDDRLADLRKLRRKGSWDALARRADTLKTKMSRARELFIDGDLTRAEYEEKKTLLQDEIEALDRERSKSDDLDAEIRHVEDLRRTLMSIENPFSGHYEFIISHDDCVNLIKDRKAIENPLCGHYAFVMSPDDCVDPIDKKVIFANGLVYGSKEKAARRRQEFYRKAGMRVRVGEELEIDLGVSKLSTASS